MAMSGPLQRARTRSYRHQHMIALATTSVANERGVVAATHALRATGPLWQAPLAHIDRHRRDPPVTQQQLQLGPAEHPRRPVRQMPPTLAWRTQDSAGTHDQRSPAPHSTHDSRWVRRHRCLTGDAERGVRPGTFRRDEDARGLVQQRASQRVDTAPSPWRPDT